MRVSWLMCWLCWAILLVGQVTCIGTRNLQVGSPEHPVVENKAAVQTRLASKDIQIHNESSGTVRVANNDWRALAVAFGGGLAIPSPLHFWWSRRRCRRTA